MNTTLVTGPNATIRTVIPTGGTTTRSAIVDAKEYIVNRCRTGRWVRVNDIIDNGRRMSRAGFRSRLSELTKMGYFFERYYDFDERLISIRLVNFPGTNFLGNYPY